MKISTLKLSLIAFLIITSLANSQAYYPQLKNLFLYNEGDESVFNEDTQFFRLGLRKSFNKLFYGDLQTSNSGNTNNFAAFYSMKIVPRFIFEVDFFDTSIKLKYNVPKEGKYPSFPLIYNEYLISDENGKMGKGDITINQGSISLQFSNDIVAFNTKDSKPEFLIERINYNFKNNVFEIELMGQFTTELKIKKVKIEKDSKQVLKLFVKNNTISIAAILNQKEIKLFEKTITKEEVKE